MYSTYTALSARDDRSRDRIVAFASRRHSSSPRARDDDAFVSDDAKRALRLAAVVVIDDVARGAREPPRAAPKNAARGGGERERERERRRMGLARTRVCGYVRVERCDGMRAMCARGVRDVCDYSRAVAMRFVVGDRDRWFLPYPSARARALCRGESRGRSRARACGGDGNGIDSAVDVADAMGD